MKRFDEEINFNNVLFHGLSHYETGNFKIKIGLQRLANILRSGGILSRKQIYNKFGEKYYERWQKEFCRVNWNGLDNVSVCLKTTKNNIDSEAFKLFVRNSVSIILDNKVLLDLNVDDTTKLEDGEFQIKNKIDIKYIIGVAVPVFNPKQVAIHKKNEKGWSRKETESWISEYYSYCIDDVFKILNHYNIDVPVYSINDGKIIKPLNIVLDEVYGKENNLNV